MQKISNSSSSESELEALDAKISEKDYLRKPLAIC